MAWERKRNGRVERLRWQLIAALSGISVAAVTCGGRSESEDDATPHPNGGTGGTSGGRGGTSDGAAGARTEGGGTSGGSGNSGSAGEPQGGMGPIGGTAGAGRGGVPELGTCDEPEAWRGLVRCSGNYVHRPTPTSCPYPPRDGEAGGGGVGGAGDPFSCATDADCGPNGYCAYALTDTWECVFADCETDADCPAGSLCACNRFGDAGVLGECHIASCTTDADCDGDALCVSPINQGGCFGEAAFLFACQTTEDECWGPDACEGSNPACEREGNPPRFVCGPGEACGRPFVVRGVARRASAVPDAGSWIDLTDASTVAPADLSHEERRQVAQHFVQAALMEHASIAAFARFALQLLALGAPPRLVEDATRAMADETRHARTCFGLARRYGAPLLGPGPLAMDGALARVDLLDVVELVVTEGCIGETVAALEAAWAADEAEDPEVARALASIAEDEASHSALAFRFVGWAREQDERVMELYERCLAEARSRSADHADDGSRAERSARLARHGVLDLATRREARRRALHDVIPGVFPAAPSAGALEASAS